MMWRPSHGAHLRLGVDSVQARASCHVPESNRSIRRSRTRGEQRSIPGAPVEAFDGGAMMSKRVHRRRGAHIEDVQAIVVAAAREMRVVTGPRKAAHLLHVAAERGDDGRRRALVVMQQLGVARARRNERRGRGDGRHARTTRARERASDDAAIDVVDAHGARRRADDETTTVARERQTGDVRVRRRVPRALRREIEEMMNGLSGSVEKVDGA